MLGVARGRGRAGSNSSAFAHSRNAKNRHTNFKVRPETVQTNREGALFFSDYSLEIAASRKKHRAVINTMNNNPNDWCARSIIILSLERKFFKNANLVASACPWVITFFSTCHQLEKPPLAARPTHQTHYRLPLLCSFQINNLLRSAKTAPQKTLSLLVLHEPFYRAQLTPAIKIKSTCFLRHPTLPLFVKSKSGPRQLPESTWLSLCPLGRN